MNEDELLLTVKKLLAPDQISDSELEALVETFVASIPHPAGTDLIYYPEEWGLPGTLSAELIVKEAISWRPRIVVMTVTYVRQHPHRDDLRFLGVELKAKMRTQVVSRMNAKVGDKCIVALSGVQLANGSRIKHRFIDRAFTAGDVLGFTDESPGKELLPSDFANSLVPDLP